MNGGHAGLLYAAALDGVAQGVAARADDSLRPIHNVLVDGALRGEASPTAERPLPRL